MFGKPKEVKPPGPALQYLNKLVHKEPISFLVYGVFWSLMLIIGFPIAGFALVMYTFIIEVIYKPFIRGKAEIVDPTKEQEDNNKELCVYITGCDSGFGKDLAFDFAELGFHVFAACLTEAGVNQFSDTAKIKAIQVDVTQQKDVDNAVKIVTDWLNEESCDGSANNNNKQQRVLHSIINNAGIGHIGIVDWTDVNIYRKVMDVNCMGVIRNCKAFLPLFKKQIYENTYKDARIVNVLSVASFISTTGASAYSCSKHAAEAFTSCLKMEMKPFGLPVVSVNPSWHKTPLSESTPQLLQKIWSSLPHSQHKEYGEDYFSDFTTIFQNKQKIEWDPKIVLKEIKAVVTLKKPADQVIVGSDGKFFVMPVLLLPTWMQMKIWDMLAPMRKPASMK